MGTVVNQRKTENMLELDGNQKTNITWLSPSLEKTLFEMHVKFLIMCGIRTFSETDLAHN